MAFKKPTLKKFPKAPKAGASKESLKRYADTCEQIKKDNLKKLSVYESEKRERESLKKKAKDSKEKVKSKSASV